LRVYVFHLFVALIWGIPEWAYVSLLLHAVWQWFRWRPKVSSATARQHVTILTDGSLFLCIASVQFELMSVNSVNSNKQDWRGDSHAFDDQW